MQCGDKKKGWDAGFLQYMKGGRNQEYWHSEKFSLGAGRGENLEGRVQKAEGSDPPYSPPPTH